MAKPIIEPEKHAAVNVAKIGNALDGLRRDLPSCSAEFKSNAAYVLHNHCDELIDLLADLRKQSKGGK